MKAFVLFVSLFLSFEKGMAADLPKEILNCLRSKYGLKSKLNKIPLMIILGEKEVESNSISIRRRFVGNQGSMDLDSFLKTILDEVKQRAKSPEKSND